MKVATQVMLSDEADQAIDDAARLFDADVIAIATHAQDVSGTLERGSVAWRALSQSPVPILIRHIQETDMAAMQPEPGERRIMVPLDGSVLAERALPLARQLASEWSASLCLVHVVSRYPITGFSRTEIDPDAVTEESALESSLRYLDQIAARIGGDVHTRVLIGSPVDELVVVAASCAISDVVISSHGRTGLARVILGSVADSLIQRLDLPIIVVPALTARDADDAVGVTTVGDIQLAPPPC